MARKLRIEYPGAIYHIINRGNYRSNVFASSGAAQSFVSCLQEASTLYRWHIHAYVIMLNHFHLVVETTEPNLTKGMHWLMGTYATRFNRFRRERGHIFQGRYHALLIENAQVMGHVVDYVHLNPVRAGVVTAAQITEFPWSSLTRFHNGNRFPGLCSEGALSQLSADDTTEGWSAYLTHLSALSANLEQQKQLGFHGFSSGWAIGQASWQRAIAEEHKTAALTQGLPADEAKALRETNWRMTLDQQLKQAGRTRAEALAAPKTALWKLELALAVRAQSGASIAWMTKELKLGTEGTARSLMSRLRKR